MGSEVPTPPTAAAAASPNHFVSAAVIVGKARVIEMRAAGHFRLLHGFLLLRLSTTIAAAAAAAGQFVSVPTLPSRDPLVLLRPIQSFTHRRRASEFCPAVLSPDRVPLLLDGGDDDDGGLVVRAVADVGLLRLVAVVDRLVPEAGVPTAATSVREIEPGEAQVQRRHVRSTERG